MIREKYRKLNEIEIETKEVQNAIKQYFTQDFKNSSTLRNVFLEIVGKNKRCLKIFKEHYKKEYKEISLSIELKNNEKTNSNISIGYFIRNFNNDILKCEIWINEDYSISKTPLYFRIFDLKSLTLSGENNLKIKDFKALLSSYSNKIIFKFKNDAFIPLDGIEVEDIQNNLNLIFNCNNLGDMSSLMKVKPNIFRNISEINFYSYKNSTKVRIFKKLLCSSILRYNYNTKFIRKQRPMMMPRPSIIMNLKEMFKFIE